MAGKEFKLTCKAILIKLLNGPQFVQIRYQNLYDYLGRTKNLSNKQLKVKVIHRLDEYLQTE